MTDPSPQPHETTPRSPIRLITRWAAIIVAALLTGVFSGRPLVALQVLLLGMPTPLHHALLLLGVAGTGYLATRFGGEYPWWAAVFAVQLIHLATVRFLPAARRTAPSWRIPFVIIGFLSCIAFFVRDVHPLRAALIAGAFFAAAWAQPRSRTPRRAIVVNAVLLTVSVLVSIAGIEAALRFMPAPEKVYLPGDGTLVAHPDYFFTLPEDDHHAVQFAPDYPETFDEFMVDIHPPGIRNEPVPLKAANEYRIGLIGDSFTFGWGLEYEDTIGQQLEALLNENDANRTYRVINLGVPGYGPWQEAAFLRERGFGLDLDHVIIQLFPSNDLENELSRQGKVLRSYFTFWQERLNGWRAYASWQLRAERWLRNHSRVYRTLYDYAPQWNLVNFFNALRFIDPAPTVPLPPNEGRPSTLEALHINPFPEVGEAWAMIQETLEALKADCTARGIQVAGYVIPMYQQMDDQAWRALRGELPATYGAPIDRFKDIEDAETVLAQAGYPVIPVADALRAVSDPRTIYFIHDTHLRQEGAHVVAKTIAQFLQQRLP